MTGLLVFVGIVAAVAAVGFALGMIVAGRIDRVLAPRAPAPAAGPPADPSAPTPPLEEHP